MTPPDAATLFRALAETWPGLAARSEAGWTLREGAGGGKRVSAATAGAGARAEEAPDLVQIRPGDAALDAALEAAGYRRVDETMLYRARAGPLAVPLPHASCYWTGQRLAIMEEIWAAGGIGEGRLAVMDRAPGPKTHLLCRADDRTAGVGFVAVFEGVAMVHALEVLAGHRRKGAGRLMMHGAAHWAKKQGAEWIALAVTCANAPARTLYEGLGMEEVARYHYRVRET